MAGSSDRRRVLVVSGARSTDRDRIVDRLDAAPAVGDVRVTTSAIRPGYSGGSDPPPDCVVVVPDSGDVGAVADATDVANGTPVVAVVDDDRTRAAFGAGATEVHPRAAGVDGLVHRVERVLATGAGETGSENGGGAGSEDGVEADVRLTTGGDDTATTDTVGPTGPGAPDSTASEAAADAVTAVPSSGESAPESASSRLREKERRLEAIHEFAYGVTDCETVEEVCWRTVEAAERILAFDTCYVGLVDDGYVVPTAATNEEGPLALDTVPVDEGVVGETLATGESRVHDDIRGSETAEPADERYASGLSIPIDEAGVFQAISAERGGFTDDDRELAELLLAHTREALQRIRYEAELREERDRIAALFENLPEPVAACHADGERPIVDDVNAAFERVFGYDAAEIVGENIDEYVLPEDATAVSLDDTYYVGDTVQTEVERRTTTGTRDFLLTVIPAELGDYSAEGFVVYSDITGRKRREAELRRQNSRLEEFTSLVSHDLRNPLNVATGHLDLARAAADADTDTDADATDHIETAANALGRMEGLIGDFLSLSRQGRTVDETEPVDLGDAARRAWETVDTGPDATLVVRDGNGGDGDRVGSDGGDGDLGTVPADRERLRTVFENLFRNSVEHGGEGVHVTVGPLPADGGPAETDGGRRGFYVADDGPGIPEDDREDVFEYGFSSESDGTGFGLATVQRIVEAHGWSVEVGDDSVGLDGATFVVRTD